VTGATDQRIVHNTKRRISNAVITIESQKTSSSCSIWPSPKAPVCLLAKTRSDPLLTHPQFTGRVFDLKSDPTRPRLQFVPLLLSDVSGTSRLLCCGQLLRKTTDSRRHEMHFHLNFCLANVEDAYKSQKKATKPQNQKYELSNRKKITVNPRKQNNHI
jgi:hypothetical protein